MSSIWGVNSAQVRNRLIMLALTLSSISIITEYWVEVLLAGSSNVILVDTLNIFSVNLEASIPTWFSTITLFVLAVLLTFITLAKFRNIDPYRWHWLGLAIGFCYLSIDEGAGLHELFVEPMKQAFNPSGFFAFGWQIVAIPVVLAVIVLYARFILHLPTRTRIGLILSGALYLGGAMIVEGISANLWDISKGISMSYLAIANIEELFEMLGMVLFVYTLLDMMEQEGYLFTLQQTETQPSPQKTHEPRRFPLIIPLLIIINVMLLGWLMLTPQPPLSDEDTIIEAPFYYSVQEQILADGGVIVEMQGIFGIDDPFSRQMGATLLEQYANVTAIAQPTLHKTIMIATHSVTFSRDDFTDLLHNVGQTNFILFETETVQTISQLP